MEYLNEKIKIDLKVWKRVGENVLVFVIKSFFSNPFSISVLFSRKIMPAKSFSQSVNILRKKIKDSSMKYIV